jgi:Fe-Mn family superoxide dismutase
MIHQLPQLTYPFEALEPFIDAETMEIHYSRHHQAYVDNLNKALQGTGFEETSLEELMQQVSNFSPAVRNNGGGHYNHSFFWKLLSVKGDSAPTGELALAIDGAFGSFETFKTKFAEAAATRFGSGWAWLIIADEDNSLTITSTPNQDNPIMNVADVKGTPILALDVWEHAYYLKYRNKRPDYISAFWSAINWETVEFNYLAALESQSQKTH